MKANEKVSKSKGKVQYSVDQSVTRRKLSNHSRQTVMGYLFLLPTLLFFIIFFIIPVLFSLLLSFSKWGGFDLKDIQWVGLSNYKYLFSSDSVFLHPILTNTLWFAFGSVILAFIISVVVAYMISRLRYEGFWRTLYFLPMVTTVVAVGNVWKYMYNPNGGLINALLRAVGLPSIAFLQNTHTALASIIVVSVWVSIGGSILILTAGLKGIPESYYEAAELEGAGPTKVFWHITLPLLRPSMLFVLITGFINGLQSFTLTKVMTNDGGPANSTNVGGLAMYNEAFQYGSWGIACAMAFVLFVVVLIVTVLQLTIFRRGGVESY